MQIRFIDPFSRAWARMTKALFKPFDISKWFVVGFTAFLSGLMDGYNGGNGTSSLKDNDFGIEDFFGIPQTIQNWFLDHPGWFTLILIGIVLVSIILIVLTWLSSRGKFMFLDNVVHDRALISKPWRQFKTLGDSLFLWRLTYGIVLLIIMGSYLWFCFDTLRDMYFEYSEVSSMIGTVIIMGIIFLIMLLIIIYIALFLNDFIVPIMYKRDQKAMVAWGHFLALFSQHRSYFILYGLFVLLLFILFIIFIIVAGFLTCCIGFILLIIPYINSVVTLPFAWAYRSFSLHFLEQFGTDYKLYQDEPVAPIETAGP